jgi:hypothetical protein
MAATLFALLLVALPASLTLISLAPGMSPSDGLISILLLIAGTAAGAALAGLAFFALLAGAPGAAARGGAAAAALLLGTVAGALWRQLGSNGPTSLPAGAAATLALLTPAPVLYGLADPPGWEPIAARWGLPAAGSAGLLLAAFLVAITGIALWQTRVACCRLARAPERLGTGGPGRWDSGIGEAGCGLPTPAPRTSSRCPSTARPAAPAARRARRPSLRLPGERGNPVWLLELRTRLRSRETAGVVLFASLAVAAGGFAPVLTAARELGDPLRTAALARQAFQGLGLALVGLVAIVGPRMGATAFAAERAGGSLPLLLATPLSPRAILAGKALGVLCLLVLLLCPSLPLLGLCCLYRGASERQLAELIALLAVLAGGTTLAGVTAAAAAGPGLAVVLAYLLTGLLVAAPGGCLALVARITAPATVGPAAVPEGGDTLLLALFCGIALWQLGRDAVAALRGGVV